jgi:polyhydroxybutyrate depolymerase
MLSTRVSGGAGSDLWALTIGSDSPLRMVAVLGHDGVRVVACSQNAIGLALLLACLGCDRAQPATKEDAAKTPPAAAVAPPTAPASGARWISPASSAGSVTQRLEAPLHLPERLAPGVRAPLLIVLHGLGASAETLERNTDLPGFASQQGIAWLAPNGPFDRKGRRFWNAGSSCCNFDQLVVDHVAALAELIERHRDHPRIDRQRVFVLGYSNGGFMAHRLGCERPDLLRGIASVAGAGPLEPVTCKVPQGLRVLQAHGDADEAVTYRGGRLFNKTAMPEHASAAKTVADWAARLGCPEKPMEAAPFDFDGKLAGSETAVARYSACSRGAIELWTVAGGNHYIGFRSQALEAMWKFLNR